MKRKLFIVSVLALSVFLGGCNGGDADKSDNDTPVENAVDETENTAEETKDEAEDELESEDELVEDSAKEGQDVSDELADLEWPVDFMTNVPEFEGTIFKVNEKDADHMYVAYEDVTQEEAVEYVQTLKDSGFANDFDEYIASTVVNFKGYDKDGNFVKFRWSENGYATVDIIYPEDE